VTSYGRLGSETRVAENTVDLRSRKPSSSYSLIALTLLARVCRNGVSPRALISAATARTSREASPRPCHAASVHTALISVHPEGCSRSPAIATDQDDLVKAAQQHTGPAGADIILDFVMGPGLADLANAAKFNGTLVSAGYLDPRPAPFPRKAPLTIYRYMSFEHTLDATVVHRIAAFLTAGLRTGALRPAIDQVFTLDDIVAVHRYLEQGPQRPGKIVVTV